MAVGTYSGATYYDEAIGPAIAAGIFLCAIFAVLSRRSVVVIYIIAAFALGFMLAMREAEVSSGISIPIASNKLFNCNAVVIDEPAMKAWGTSIDARLAECGYGKKGAMRAARGAVRISTRIRAEDIASGDRIHFIARFGRPREFRNPGSFSYGKYLLGRGIAATAWASDVERMGEGDANAIARIVRMARQRISRSIEGATSGEALAVLESLALGRTDRITSEMRDEFSATGLSHILAISGMQVGLVAAMIYMISRLVFGFFPGLLLRIPLQRIAAAITLPSMWGYVMLTGYVVSVVRAAIMLTVYLIGIIIGRRQDLITTLAVAVIAILILMPLAIFDVSFQLSVVCVLGIIIMVPWMMRPLGGFGSPSWKGRALQWSCAAFAMTIAATIASSPLVAYHFKIFTLVGIFANAVAVPYSTIVLIPLVAIGSAYALISPGFAYAIWKIGGAAAEVFLWIVERSDELGRGLVFHLAPNALETALVYAIMAAAILVRRPSRKIGLIAALSVALAIDFGYWRLMPALSDNLEIYSLDVGMGDSTLVRFPGGKTLLIDGGGIKGSDFDVGRNAVAPALWRLGIHSIDLAMLTHPHHDHYRGLGFVANNFKPELIWTNGLEAPSDEMDDWEKFLADVKSSGVPMEIVQDDGISMDLGGAKLRVIKPPWKDGDDLNDSSLVTSIEYAGKRVLFMGDLTAKREGWLLSKGIDLRSDILKVGHHGSSDATSMEFLEAVRPTEAIISVGAGNKYGFPHAEALERLDASGARIKRTDQEGMIGEMLSGH